MNTDAFIAGDVIPAAVRAAEETVWVNPRLLPFDVVDGLSQLIVSDELPLSAALFPRRRRRMVSSSRRCARFLRCRRGFLMHTEQRFRGVSC